MAVGVTVAWGIVGLAGRASAATFPSLDWYGYAVTGATYTSTTADWTMPAVTCTTSNSYVAIWTGLDGYTSDTVEQTGAEVYCSGKTPEYYGWYELYPANPVDFSNSLKPGDKLQASVTYGDSKFTLTLRDATQGWTQTVTKALAGAARSSAETVVQVPDSFTCPAPLTLAAVTGDTVDGSPLGSLDPVEGTGGDPDIVVSPVSGKSFSVSCK
jgi:hypothetical protein